MMSPVGSSIPLQVTINARSQQEKKTKSRERREEREEEKRDKKGREEDIHCGTCEVNGRVYDGDDVRS